MDTQRAERLPKSFRRTFAADRDYDTAEFMAAVQRHVDQPVDRVSPRDGAAQDPPVGAVPVARRRLHSNGWRGVRPAVVSP